MSRFRTTTAVFLLAAMFGMPASADELDLALDAEMPKITVMGNQSLALDRRAIESAVNAAMGDAGRAAAAPRVLDVERPAGGRHVVLELRLLPNGPEGRLTLGPAQGYESAGLAAAATVRDRRFDTPVEAGNKANSLIRVPLRLDLADD